MARKRLLSFDLIINWVITLGIGTVLVILFRLFVLFMGHVFVTPNPEMVGTWEATVFPEETVYVLPQKELKLHLVISEDGHITGTVGDGEFHNTTLAKSSAFSFQLGMGKYHSRITFKTAIEKKDKVGWAAAQITMWKITPETMQCSFKTLDKATAEKPALQIKKFVLTKLES